MGNRLRKMTPRNGHTLVAFLMNRISGCANQKEDSLKDQNDNGRATVAEYYDGPVEFRALSTKGKGERLDRPELEELDAQLRSREIDLLFAEDLGRIIRGGGAARLCGLAVDCGTRVISPRDGKCSA